LRADVAKGDPGNRVGRDELTRKFYQCAGNRRSAAATEQILDRLMHLERVENVAELTSLWGPATVAAR
jgi:hypothetical protein